MIQNQFLVPSLIDFKMILDSMCYTDSYIEHHIDKYNYIVHTILEKQVLNRDLSSHGYTNINMQVLRSFIGKRYADDILHELVRERILQRSYYIPGVKSFAYRVAPKYRSKATLRSVYKSEVWDRKLGVQKRAYKAQRKNLAEFSNLCKLEIDAPAAQAFIDTMHDNSMLVLNRNAAQLGAITVATDPMFRVMYSCVKLELSECKPAYQLMSLAQLGKAMTVKPNAGLSLCQILSGTVMEQYNADMVSIHKIVTNDFFLEQPDKKSRQYTNLTNMSTHLRQFLSVNKSKSVLCNSDIANSQPYIFSLLLMDKYKGAPLPEDVATYIRLTSSGKFYEHIMGLLSIPLADRKEFKIQFFAKIFFCKTRYSKGTVEGKLFEKEFPNVYSLINEYKTVAHEDLAIAMQRKEASVMLKSIADELKKQKIWFATIHDSVVCLEEHAAYVKELILSRFMAAVGISPTVTRETLKPGYWVFFLN